MTDYLASANCHQDELPTLPIRFAPTIGRRLRYLIPLVGALIFAVTVPKDRSVVGYAMLGILAALTLGGLADVILRRAFFEVSATGLTVSTLLGSRSLSWNDLQSFETADIVGAKVIGCNLAPSFTKYLFFRRLGKVLFGAEWLLPDCGRVDELVPLLNRMLAAARSR